MSSYSQPRLLNGKTCNVAMTQAERITALEVKVDVLVQELRETNKNLNDLLALRNKGAGVFWIVTTLFGASLVSGIHALTLWMKG